MFLNDLIVTPQQTLGISFPGSETANYPAISQGGMSKCRLSASWSVPIGDIQSRSDALRALGIRPFLTFECDDESRTRPDTHGITNQIPLDMNGWTAFVTDVVNLGEADFQFCNEWNVSDLPDGGWLGTDLELIDFVVQSTAAVKAANPNSEVWMGGITSGTLDGIVLNKGMASYQVCYAPDNCQEPAFFQTAAATAEFQRIKDILAGVSGSVDGLDLHLYGPEDRDELRVQAIRDEGWAKPLISAECGGPSLNYESYTGDRHFMAVTERMLNIAVLGLDSGLWFRLSETNGSFGNSKTALSAGGIEKPGYFAMKMLASFLEGATSITKTGRVYETNTGRIIAWGGAQFVPPAGEMWDIVNRSTGEYTVWNVPEGWPFPITANDVTVAGM